MRAGFHGLLNRLAHLSVTPATPLSFGYQIHQLYPPVSR
jgi:hypothetical protein